MHRGIRRSRGLWILLFAASMVSGLSEASSVPFLDTPITIQAKNKTFTEIIDLIAREGEIVISVEGFHPSGKKDISIGNLSIEKAISHAIHLFGIQNHSAVYYTGTPSGVELLLVSETANERDLVSGQKEKESKLEFKLLTKDEFELVQLMPSTDFRTLTEEEFAKLPPDQGNFKTLTEEEFTQLASDGSPDNFKTLNDEEFYKLTSDSPENFGTKFLTEEEFLKLKPTEQQE